MLEDVVAHHIQGDGARYRSGWGLLQVRRVNVFGDRLHSVPSCCQAQGGRRRARSATMYCSEVWAGRQTAIGTESVTTKPPRRQDHEDLDKVSLDGVQLYRLSHVACRKMKTHATCDAHCNARKNLVLVP